MGVNKQATTNVRQPTSKQANKRKIETKEEKKVERASAQTLVFLIV
jgi:hypothetical protein